MCSLASVPEPAYLSVGDVAARFGVTTQAVYKWLQRQRIEGTRGPGGSWRIPAAQFERDMRPASSRESLDSLPGRAHAPARRERLVTPASSSICKSRQKQILPVGTQRLAQIVSIRYVSC